MNYEQSHRKNTQLIAFFNQNKLLNFKQNDEL